MQSKFCRNCVYSKSIPPWQLKCGLWEWPKPAWTQSARADGCPSYRERAPQLPRVAEAPGPWDPTLAGRVTCQFCFRQVDLIIRFDAYGGHLMVCQDCRAALKAVEHQPYSRLMDRFCLATMGFYSNRKHARWPESLGGRRKRTRRREVYGAVPG